jgi:hypothetical protein
MPPEAIARPSRHCCAAALVAVLTFGAFVLGGEALSQDGSAASPPAEPPAASLAPLPPAEPSPPAAQAPSSSSRPGLIDALGGLLRDSADGVSSTLKDTHQRIQDMNKGTLDTLTSIPVAGLATGRALCPRSANGAPDCYAASEKLCKDKGYSVGRSLDSETAETCNPRIYLPGYKRKEGDCKVETFVTRAACQ